MENYLLLMSPENMKMILEMNKWGKDLCKRNVFYDLV